MGVLDTLYDKATSISAAAQDKVNQWLEFTDTTAGQLVHTAAIVAAQVVAQQQAMLVSPTGFNPALLNTIGTSINAETASFINTVVRTTQYPNIEGIVIFADKEGGSRQMTVSEQPLVTQRNGAGTTYVMDNAIPHPREWQLSGHITSNLPTDHFLILKPSILAQKKYLDMCMLSRRPVLFKSFDNEFIRVLITSFSYDWDPKTMNALKVSIALKEYIPFYVQAGLATPEVITAIAKYPIS